MILITGATGYIGSHTWIELLGSSFQVVGVDNLSNSSFDRVGEISTISGENPIFIEGDIRDKGLLTNIFTKYPITHVIHLAGLKDVGESMVKHKQYFDVNVGGLRNLLEVMRAHDCYKIIFSSSAAVYGERASSPISEKSVLVPSNYYGQTKLEGERLLADEFNKTPAISSVNLRYFNVAGSHPSGLLFDNTLATSHSLFSEIAKVLAGQKNSLSIYGDDWATRDGTCIRDYLHVSDLARGHLDALKLLDRADDSFTLNLGSGIGQTVYEVISAYEGVAGRKIPRSVVGRRLGDVGVSFADTRLPAQVMGWSPKKTLSDMCSDSYRSCNK
ncbi:UDP-glucose 4-epimerase GalE [Polynucleobacter paneuropaeus]|jgi:UDP-glucose 4-epimerase|nr:UDP-glucose 4-epimerase GalE [Polynucleobacter paneuropaeus]